ncbi:unnamed protein product, partial [Prorocentrum cordatum]
SIPPLSPPPDACLPPPPREALEETEGDGAEPVRGPEDDFLLLLTHAEQQAQISQVQELAPEERREEGAALREGHCDAGPEVQGGAVDVSGVPDGVLSGFACCRCLTLLQVPDTGRLGKIETKVFCSFLFLGALAGPRDRQKTTRDEKFSTCLNHSRPKGLVGLLSFSLTVFNAHAVIFPCAGGGWGARRENQRGVRARAPNAPGLREPTKVHARCGRVGPECASASVGAREVRKT